MIKIFSVCSIHREALPLRVEEKVGQRDPRREEPGRSGDRPFHVISSICAGALEGIKEPDGLVGPVGRRAFRREPEKRLGVPQKRNLEELGGSFGMTQGHVLGARHKRELERGWLAEGHEQRVLNVFSGVPVRGPGQLQTVCLQATVGGQCRGALL